MIYHCFLLSLLLSIIAVAPCAFSNSASKTKLTYLLTLFLTYLPAYLLGFLLTFLPTYLLTILCGLVHYFHSRSPRIRCPWKASAMVERGKIQSCNVECRH